MNRSDDKSDLFRLGDLIPHRRPADGTVLPPGQREISSFPRYGTHLASPDPAIPPQPVIEIDGCSSEPLTLEALGQLPRTHLVADFHCVAGWTARNVEWDGVRFSDLCHTVPVPTATTHIRVVGRDGYRAVLMLEDALAADVLIADALGGSPIPAAHGGPVRLISASQYGYKSVKHLSRIEFHDREPSDNHRHRAIGSLLKPLGTHPRARVWQEERHRRVPAWALRRIYRTVIHPIPYVLGYLGSRGERT
jgi:DMSO/TMAO reductase YedYZ molybdopterin-dependent catalytic subunit